MSVTSVEALEALPVGSVVAVKLSTDERPVDWQRGAAGWVCPSVSEEAALQSHMFEGLLNQGWVTSGPAVSEVQVGQWRAGRTYWYFCLAVHDNTQAMVLRFRQSGATAPLVTSTARLREYDVMVQPPTITSGQWQAAMMLLWERAAAEQATAERVRVQFKNRVAPEALHPAVRQVRDSVAALEAVLTANNVSTEF